MASHSGQEIERKYLLRLLPVFPDAAVDDVQEIDQGYYHDSEFGDIARVRRTRHRDGTRSYVRTMKRGAGLVREEREDELTKPRFEEIWTSTIGRRVRKRRYRVRWNSRIWEIDEFLDRDLVLAEVELPSVDAEAPFPPWLAPVVDREVTDDLAYTNRNLAR